MYYRYGNQQLVTYNVQCPPNHIAFFNLTFADMEPPTCLDRYYYYYSEKNYHSALQAYTNNQCSPQANLRHDRRSWCRWSCSHIKAFGLSHSHIKGNFCTEGLLGQHTLGMLGRILIVIYRKS